jgi:predicted nucleic acid-binding protein
VPSIAVDAGPLIALFDGGDSRHKEALCFFERAETQFVTNVAVITETAHMLSFSRRAMNDFLGWVGTAFQLDAETVADLPRIMAIMAKYADLPADFADASLVALCERAGIDRIATFDRDFEVYRLANRTRLVNVFDKG